MAQTRADIKGQFKPLTEGDISGRTDSGSFSRGKDYYQNRKIGLVAYLLTC
jgi:hypothetical protein